MNTLAWHWASVNATFDPLFTRQNRDECITGQLRCHIVTNPVIITNALKKQKRS